MKETDTPKEQRLSIKELEKLRIDIFDSKLGPFHGDVYKAALTCFSTFSTLKDMYIRINPYSNHLSGGLDGEGGVGIYIGTQRESRESGEEPNEGAVTPRIRSRIIERFHLPSEYSRMPDGAFTPFILAHELAHVIQADAQFPEHYGSISEDHLSPENDYGKYVESDSEVNADFITLEIIGHTEFGSLAGVSAPEEGRSEWRTWADTHSVQESVNKFG